jgi:hypothetical protein
MEVFVKQLSHILCCLRFHTSKYLSRLIVPRQSALCHWNKHTKCCSQTIRTRKGTGKLGYLPHLFPKLSGKSYWNGKQYSKTIKIHLLKIFISPKYRNI